MKANYTILISDDLTNVQIVRPSGGAYAQPWSDRKSRKRKRPLGFQVEETKRKEKK